MCIQSKYFILVNVIGIKGAETFEQPLSKRKNNIYKICDHELMSTSSPRYILNNISNFDIFGAGASLSSGT